jgi:hypothetical protein
MDLRAQRCERQVLHCFLNVIALRNGIAHFSFELDGIVAVASIVASFILHD